MCISITLNNKIKRAYEQAQRITYNDRKSSFKSLLEKGHYSAIHKQDLQYLAVELFK